MLMQFGKTIHPELLCSGWFELLSFIFVSNVCLLEGSAFFVIVFFIVEILSGVLSSLNGMTVCLAVATQLVTNGCYEFGMIQLFVFVVDYCTPDDRRSISGPIWHNQFVICGLLMFIWDKRFQL